MHKSNFVVAVRNNGKSLRETRNGTVYLPYGSEYSILLRNLENRKARVTVTIDGEDVLGGSSLILDKHGSVNCETDLERFLNGDNDKGRRFRFIEKTDKISNHRGDKAEDGILRVEVTYEADFGGILGSLYESKPHNSWGGYRDTVYGSPSIGSPLRGLGNITCGATINTKSFSAQVDGCKSPEVMNVASKFNDSGITVPGSESKQKFKTGTIGLLENQTHVFTFQLKGEDPLSKVEVQKPLTTRTKVTCPTCGDKHTSGTNYCGDCGTYIGAAA